MNYDSFVAQLKEKVHEELGVPSDKIKFYREGYTSDDPQMLAWVKDCNDRFVGEENTKLLTDILTMELPANGDLLGTQRVVTQAVYEAVLENGFDVTFEELRKSYAGFKDAQLNSDWMDQRRSGEYEKIRQGLILRPLNYKLHSRDLRGCVYKKVGDFVLALYQILSDSKESLVSSKITTEELEAWGMQDQEDKVFQDALENTSRLYPPCVYNKRTAQEVNFLEKDFVKEDIIYQNYILLSTFKATNGAMALFYPGVMEKMMKIMGGPFKAVFMNINDVLIFDRKDPLVPKYAKKAKVSGQLGEMLSGWQYLCDGSQLLPGFVVKVYGDGEVVHE